MKRKELVILIMVIIAEMVLIYGLLRFRNTEANFHYPSKPTCEDMANTKLKNLPARCFEYYKLTK